jgi:hypothetical protein
LMGECLRFKSGAATRRSNSFRYKSHIEPASRNVTGRNSRVAPMGGLAKHSGKKALCVAPGRRGARGRRHGARGPRTDVGAMSSSSHPTSGRDSRLWATRLRSIFPECVKGSSSAITNVLGRLDGARWAAA